jgi:hypothetical protein
MRVSLVLARECCKRYVKCLSSALKASDLMAIIGRKGKLDSAFLVRQLRV